MTTLAKLVQSSQARDPVSRPPVCYPSSANGYLCGRCTSRDCAELFRLEQFAAAGLSLWPGTWPRRITSFPSRNAIFRCRRGTEMSQWKFRIALCPVQKGTESASAL